MDLEINIDELKKWIAALDSGEYKQGIGCLQSVLTNLKDEPIYYQCCLGVGCIVLIDKEKLVLDGGVLHGSFPNHQPNAPYWLNEINDDFSEKTGFPLSVLNDTGLSDAPYGSCDRFTFTEIATLLELVYIHKILDEQEQPIC